METLQRENRKKALRWATGHGILPADELDALVTREELADALYHGLEYFFGEIVALLEGGTSKNGKDD